MMNTKPTTRFHEPRADMPATEPELREYTTIQARPRTRQATIVGPTHGGLTFRFVDFGGGGV